MVEIAAGGLRGIVPLILVCGCAGTSADPVGAGHDPDDRPGTDRQPPDPSPGDRASAHREDGAPRQALATVDAAIAQEDARALTGLPTPSTSTDAARKGYVDAEIAAKIGGFGISQIAIDADKNWGGWSVTNMKSLTLTEAAPDALTIIYPSNTVIASSDTPVTLTSAEDWKVVKRALVQHDGVIRIQYTHAATGGGSSQPISSRISVDGWIQVTHDSTRDQGAKTYTDDIVVRRGREVVIEGRCYAGYISNVKFMGSAGIVPYATRLPTVTVTQH